MPWGITADPRPIDDPAYDKYRDRIGALSDDSGQEVGYVVTFVLASNVLVGCRGLRPVWQPTETLRAWVVAPEHVVDEFQPTLDELDAGKVEEFQIRWLSGDEWAAAWQRYLDEWGPHDPPDLSGWRRK